MRKLIVSWIAWHLPKSVAYWAFIRVNVHAYRHNENAEMGTLTGQQILDAWRDQ